MAEPSPLQLLADKRALWFDPEFGICNATDPEAIRQHAIEEAEEMDRLGLAERAAAIFRERLPEAIVQRWALGFVANKKNVSCIFQFTGPIAEIELAAWPLGDLSNYEAPSQIIRRKAFRFYRLDTEDWHLVWDEADDRRVVLDSKSNRLLGTFEVHSGTLVLADAGYDFATAHRDHRAIPLDSARLGHWQAEVAHSTFTTTVISQNRSSQSTELTYFRACHASVADPATLVWTPAGICGVDCGPLGLFDAGAFPQEESVPADADEARVVPGGAVCEASRNGYRYSIAKTEDGDIVGVMVLFADEGRNG